MPKLCANLSLMFQEFAEHQRVHAAKQAGFEGIEIQFPYQRSAQQLKAELDANQLPLILFNLPAGDWTKGDRGIACQPERQAEFMAGVDQALHYVTVTGTRLINCLAGIPSATTTPAQALDTLRANLTHTAKRLQPLGITLLIEPINNIDIPGFLINTPAQAMALIEQITDTTRLDNLAIQCDLYHCQRMQLDPATQLTQFAHAIKHIQFADAPGRHEPGTGTINFEQVFSALKSSGYSGDISAEYLPQTDTLAGLNWLPEWKQQLAATQR